MFRYAFPYCQEIFTLSLCLKCSIVKTRTHLCMPKKTILIVDDDELLCDVLAEFFESQYTVFCACNGQDAQRIYQEQRGGIDLVLTDWNMPKLNGIELTKWLVNTAPALPVLLMTGNAKTGELDVFQNNNQVYVMNKPFEFDELAKAVAGYIGT